LDEAAERMSFGVSLSKTFGFSASFPVWLVPRKLETAQNRKVWAARAKPVLPTNDIFRFIDSLAAERMSFGRFYFEFMPLHTINIK